MAWGNAPGPEIDVKRPEDVAEERIRQIVREELAILAAKRLTEDG
jgi:hypothetical protein